MPSSLTQWDTRPFEFKALENAKREQELKIKQLETAIDTEKQNQSVVEHGGALPGTPAWYEQWNKIHRKDRLKAELSDVESRMSSARKGDMPPDATPFIAKWAEQKGLPGISGGTMRTREGQVFNTMPVGGYDNPGFEPDANYQNLERKRAEIIREMMGTAPELPPESTKLMEGPRGSLLQFKPSTGFKEVVKPETAKKETRPSLSKNESRQYTQFAKTVEKYIEEPPMDEEEQTEYITSLRGMNKLNRKNLTTSEMQEDFLDWYMQWAEELGIDFNLEEIDENFLNAYEKGIGLPGEDTLDGDIQNQPEIIEIDGSNYEVVKRNKDGSVRIKDPATGKTGTYKE